jgi:hypothetical protein
MTKQPVSRRDILRLPAAAAAATALETTASAAIPAANAPDLEPPAFERATLEMSLKPFRDVSDAGIRATCAEVFRAWAPLIRRVKSVAVMLWTADGSEILEYRGKASDEIEWARYIGIGTPPKQNPGDDPEGIGLHGQSHLYMDHPPRITYGTLASIVRTLKEVGRQAAGKQVTVGATFDPGPEFANSKFKYTKHPEIAPGGTMGAGTWVTCITRLHADPAAYAGFPKGIPEGTSIGTYLGRQSQHFLSDLGFDYLWLSNGFGFSISSWSVLGPLFDGTHFDTAQGPGIRDSLVGFWRDFRKECPAIPLETRGTNLMLGSDLATNGAPLRDLYQGNFKMTAPPNSPWAALDGDFGLEIVGYLSRIAELPPDNRFPFRYYTHDPWWLNSPWFDRYGRSPHDIYLPLSLARIDGNASITKPAYLEFLTIDNSYGRMPEQCPNEVIPHILAAMGDYSDAPGLATWLCPFDEYHDAVFSASPKPELIFFADWFLRGAVNAGFPLNGVVSTGNYLKSLAKDPEYFDHTVLVSLVPPAGGKVEAQLLERIRRGRPVLLYGPTQHASAALLDLLNLRSAAPISGDLQLKLNLEADQLAHDNPVFTLRHRELTSAGGVDTVIQDASRAGVEVRATVSNGSAERVYAVSAGAVAWLRGTFASAIPTNAGGRIPIPDSPSQFFPAESVLRLLLKDFGYSVHFVKSVKETRSPMLFAARCRNGYYLSSYSPSTAATVHLRFPQGAPLLVGAETWLADGHSTYMLPRSAHHEVRCFVDNQKTGEVSCVETYSGYLKIRRRLLLKGLSNATVRFLPEDNGPVIMAANDMRLHNETSLPFTKEDNGRTLVARGITGQLLISW